MQPLILLARSLAMAQPAQGGPLRVFVLAGQSNMEGQGAIASKPDRNGGKGSLEYLAKTVRRRRETYVTSLHGGLVHLERAKGDTSRLSLSHYGRAPRKRTILLGAYDGRYRFLRVTRT